MWPPRTLNVNLLSNHFFGPPFIVHFAVFISTCFFLYNLYIRFGTLNDLWKCLPVGLIAVSDRRTHMEIAVLIDDIRLLHSELSELMKIFSLGYGPLLIAFFTSNFINTLFNIFLAISFSDFLPHFSLTENKIIYYIRLNRISNLPVHIKRQIKMFMNQISVYESDEITAFGLFKINLNLVISMLMLLITGIATSIQMKEHPMVLKWINEIQFVAALQFKNTIYKLTTNSSVQQQI
ncbi:uncharacterized protein LOC112593258 [Melanaphis sacchari]|uniref:uncharacterized protein LOC112593258 n=1 Tax=Melanaphis sacchari TaxID=742174 RepID=UPI000DC14515|nr:uncharacterized protein LOC112593258 [Melanaphis sacchari]